MHQTTLETLKGALIQVPMLHYPDPSKQYIVYTDASDDACRAQLSQEHNAQELHVRFLSHTFTETQRKWNTPKQEAYGVYFAITKWNYYLQGLNIVVRNDRKPLQKFLNGKNTNNKVNNWSLEPATYNITFEWISGACNKAADCLSRLMEVPEDDATDFSVLVNVVTASPMGGPITHTHSKTNTLVMMPSDNTKVNAPQSLMMDCRETLIQMQLTDPFCKCISRQLNNGKAPHHKSDTFTHIDELL